MARALNANVDEIFFTSCGSESDNWALKGVNSKHIITTSIEHPAILNTCKALERQGIKITYLPVDSDGLIGLYELEESINDETGLISIMFANNEIGTIEPIKEIADIAKRHNIYF